MPESIAAHGAIFSFESTPAGGFTEVGEVGDITDPGLMRNEFDVTAHGADIDNWILGVARRDPLSITVFWNGTSGTQHNALRTALINNTFVGFSMVYPDGDDWVGSGYVRQITRNAPVDGAQSATLAIRLSGAFYLNGVLIGS